MRPVERIERIQELITKIWAFYPDMRYFQFVNYLMHKVDENRSDFFYYEDDELEQALKKIYDAEYSHMRLREFNEFCG